MDDPADLIRHGAKWQPGAWTPARCAMWNQSGDARKRVEWLVKIEQDRGECAPEQLPRIDAGRDERTGT